MSYVRFMREKALNWNNAEADKGSGVPPRPQNSPLVQRNRQTPYKLHADGNIEANSERKLQCSEMLKKYAAQGEKNWPASLTADYWTFLFDCVDSAILWWITDVAKSIQLVLLISLPIHVASVTVRCQIELL